MPVTYIYRSNMFDWKCYLLPIVSLNEMVDIVATEQVFWTLLWTATTIYNQFICISPLWLITFYHLQEKPI
jgi:hypothetical protein